MKTTISALFILSVAIIISAFQEGEKTVAVTDLRSSGVSLRTDLLTTDQHDGELIANRETVFSEKSHSGMQDLYRIHIFKTYQGKMKDCLLVYSDTNNYDQVSYKWLNDSLLSVHLVNSVTQERNKGWNIYRQGSKIQPYFGKLPGKTNAKAADEKNSVKYNYTFHFTRPDTPYNDYDTVATFTFANEAEYNAWKENGKDALKVEKIK